MKHTILLSLFALFVIANCASSQKQNALVDTEKNLTTKNTIQLFVMSQCPFGKDAETMVADAYGAIKDHARLTINYIVDYKDGTFASLHGPSEVKGNIIQLCVMKHYPMRDALDFIRCQNKSMDQIPRNWKRCASLQGFDIDALDTCYKGNEGKNLLIASAKASKTKKVEGSPTIYIGDTLYEGQRSSEQLLKTICNRFYPKNAPRTCSQLPKPIKVDVLLISDSRCKTCDTEKLEEVISKRIVPDSKITKLDYMTKEGKTAFKTYKLSHLPAVIFSKSIDQTESFSQMQRWMTKIDDAHYKLMLPPQWDPLAEICDNKKDDTGNGKTDCDDPQCSASLLCRKEVKQKLDLFVMSQCPFGAKAVLAMEEVLANFKNKIKFNIHFIASQKEDGTFRSLHGQPEVDENIRQLCAKKHYAKNNAYLKYVICRAKNYQSNDWKSCTSKAIKAKTIKKCATGKEGATLFGKDIKIAERLKVTGSPTFLLNNQSLFNGISAEKIKVEFCKKNSTLKGCNNTLSNDESQSPGSCGS